MAYLKTTWQDDVTPISSTNMNKIEQGVLDAVPKTEKGVANGVASLGSGAKIPLVQLPAISASGTFVDTTTSIGANGEYTKTIPLGFTGVSGSCQIFGYSSCSAVILFNAVQASTRGIKRILGSLNMSPAVDGDLATVVNNTADNNVILKSCYISGTNLIMVFKNITAGALSLYVTGCIWEVQA